jgi:predicted nuclease of predicted toxin-antitoxin system
MLGIGDKELLHYAFRNDLIVLTFDKDFGQLVFKEKIDAKGIILLRFSPSSPTKIKAMIRQILLDDEFDPQGKFVVVHETHLRIVDLS